MEIKNENDKKYSPLFLKIYEQKILSSCHKTFIIIVINL